MHGRLFYRDTVNAQDHLRFSFARVMNQRSNAVLLLLMDVSQCDDDLLRVHKCSSRREADIEKTSQMLERFFHLTRRSSGGLDTVVYVCFNMMTAAYRFAAR